MDLEASSVVAYELDHDVLTVDVIGAPLDDREIERLQASLHQYGQLRQTTLKVVQGPASQLNREQVQEIINARLANELKNDSGKSYKDSESVLQLVQARRGGPESPARPEPSGSCFISGSTANQRRHAELLRRSRGSGKPSMAGLYRRQPPAHGRRSRAAAAVDTDAGRHAGRRHGSKLQDTAN